VVMERESGRRSEHMTEAPSLAKRMDVARPIPIAGTG
jgi:hypothetical protein